MGTGGAVGGSGIVPKRRGFGGWGGQGIERWGNIGLKLGWEGEEMWLEGAGAGEVTFLRDDGRFSTFYFEILPFLLKRSSIYPSPRLLKR